MLRQALFAWAFNPATRDRAPRCLGGEGVDEDHEVFPWRLAGSQAPQHAAAVCLRAARHVRIEGDRVVLVRHAGVQVQLDGDAGMAESERVTRRPRRGRRRAGRPRCRPAAGRVASVRRPGAAAGIDVALFVSRSQQRVPAGDVVVVGPAGERRDVGVRVSSCDRRASGRSAAGGLLPGRCGRGSGWRRPAASPPPALSPITAIRPGSTPSSTGVLGQPGQPGVGVFDGCGVRVLGCEPVLRRTASGRRCGPRSATRGRRRSAPSRAIMPPPCRYSTAAPLSLDGRPVPPGQQRGTICRGDFMVSDLDVIGERLRLIVEVLQHRIECDAPGLHVADRGVGGGPSFPSAACRTAATSASMVNVNSGLLLLVTRRRQQLGLELRGEAPRLCDECRLCVWAERWRRFSPGGDRLADQGEELFLACGCAHAQQP